MKKLQFITTGKLAFTLILAGVTAVPLFILRAQSYQHVTEEETLAQQLENRIGGGWLERLRELRLRYSQLSRPKFSENKVDRCCLFFKP
ncbi:MAG TPA: hypothetical protein VNQ79_05265 [Blastocatellia bacterium]|nr:hypothetical protein [Blastocatellia bacterium]